MVMTDLDSRSHRDFRNAEAAELPCEAVSPRSRRSHRDFRNAEAGIS